MDADSGSLKILLDQVHLRRTLARMAHEIIEHTSGNGAVALVGIQRRGVELADRLAGLIAEFTGERPLTGSIDITFYRDDVGARAAVPRYDQPVVHSTRIPFDVTDTTVVIVDDVLFTGRTIRAAIEALFDYGRPAAVRLAVLVDRGHRELPIRPDFVGKNVPTSRSERVTVLLTEVDGSDEVRLERPGSAGGEASPGAEKSTGSEKSTGFEESAGGAGPGTGPGGEGRGAA